MFQITLPDGSKREFSQPVQVGEIATTIAPSLGKAALAGKVTINGSESHLGMVANS